MIGTVRLEPRDMAALTAGLQRMVDGLVEAFRALAQAAMRAAAAMARGLAKLVRPARPSAIVTRVQRRAERRRLQGMLRQQRRAMAYQRRIK